MTDIAQRRAAREEGSILVVLLILMIPLVGLSLALIGQGNTQTQELSSERGRAMAMLNAESGIDQGLSQLILDPDNHATIEQFYEGSPDLRYRVEISDLGADGLDNDGDLDVDEADEDGLYSLTSAGSLNVLGYDAGDNPITDSTKYYVRRVRAIAKKGEGLPGFPYAVYLGDPNAETVFNGNSFMLDGYDHDADGTTVAGTAVPGIATVGDPALIEDQISSQQVDNVIGSSGSPSVDNTTPMDIQSIIDQYKNGADITFDNPGGTFSGSLGDPDAPAYKTTYCLGNLDISGGAEGAGLLLVQGNLEITGNFNYVGIVIVTGQVIFRGGGGVKRVVGTVLVGGDIIEQTPGNSEDLEVSGTIDVLYSSAVQEAVSTAVAKVTILSWRELK